MRAFLDQVRERYKDQVSELSGDWNDNVLTFGLTTFGFKISGTLTVEEEVAKLDGQLPFPAMAFRGKIEGGIATWRAAGRPIATIELVRRLDTAAGPLIDARQASGFSPERPPVSFRVGPCADGQWRILEASGPGWR